MTANALNCDRLSFCAARSQPLSSCGTISLIEAIVPVPDEL